MSQKRTTRLDASKKGGECFLLLKTEEKGEKIRKGEDDRREREEKGTKMVKKAKISAGRSLGLRRVYNGMRGREI